jgi:arylsulfatase A-like enzyme
MNKNIIFFIIDSLRTDKVVSNFSNLNNFSKLKHEGTFFSQEISTADATLMSWSSLFTGLYPFRTGIRSARFNKLDSNVPTLFTILKEKNYDFFGFLPSLSETIGLFPDFKNYDSIFDINENLSSGLGKKILKILENKSKTSPWLLVVHIMDLHYPIHVPKEFDDDKFGKNEYEKTLSSIDFWLGKFFKQIDLENTICIITADHGCYIKPMISEKSNDFILSHQSSISKISNKIPKFLLPIKNRAFFYIEKSRKKKNEELISKLNLLPHENRALLSGRSDVDHFLFDESIRIPLFILGKDIPKDKLISNQICSIDILPTILDLLNLEKICNIDGESLVPLFDSNTILNEKFYFIESTPLVILDSNDVIGIRTNKHKYFRDKNNSKKRVHLFDLENDPFENYNIAEENDFLVSDFELKISKIYDKNQVKINNDQLSSQEIEDELRKLGYV